MKMIQATDMCAHQCHYVSDRNSQMVHTEVTVFTSEQMHRHTNTQYISHPTKHTCMTVNI